MKDFFVKKGLTFLSNSLSTTLSNRLPASGLNEAGSMPRLSFNGLYGLWLWIGRILPIGLALGMMVIMLIPQLSWVPVSWTTSEGVQNVLAYGLLIMAAYPFVRLLFSSTDVKTMMLQCLGALVHFFILIGLGVWCQSWSLVTIIQKQSLLLFGVQFFPLVILDSVRYMITPPLILGHRDWDQVQRCLDWGVFLIGMNLLFWGGGDRPFAAGGLVLKMVLMYGVLKWSSMSFIKLSPEQTTRALLKYLLPLSFSVFVVFFWARMVMVWWR